MAELIWRCSSLFSNNKQSHHDVTAVLKDYQCVSQRHDFFQTFHYFSMFHFRLPKGKKDEIWFLLITLTMLRRKYVKSR